MAFADINLYHSTTGFDIDLGDYAGPPAASSVRGLFSRLFLYFKKKKGKK